MAKEPWLAVFLSALLPGVGQLYGCDRRTRGIALIALWFLLVLISGTNFIVFIIYNNLTLSRVSLLILVLTFLIIPIFYIYILFDAHKTAAKHTVLHHINIQLATEKKSWLAVFLTYIFPGLGQFYNKQLFKGIAFILIAVFFVFAVELYPFVHFFTSL